LVPSLFNRRTIQLEDNFPVVIRFQPFLFVYGRSDFRFWRAAVYFFDVFPRDELSLFCVFFYVVHGRGKVIRTQRKGLRMSPVFPVVFFVEKNQRQGTGIAAARLIFRPAPHGWSHACGTGKPRPWLICRNKNQKETLSCTKETKTNFGRNFKAKLLGSPT
jgi:hypothetical protein